MLLAVLLAAGGVVGLMSRSEDSGSSTAETGPAVSPEFYVFTENVCALLTRAEIEAMLGVPMGGGDNPGITSTFADIPGITKCRYAPADQPQFKLETGVFAGNALPTYQETKQVRRGLTSEPVAGLGEEALWYPQGHELLVLANGRILGLSIGGDASEPDADLRERAGRLATKALARLR